jgi:uncharacterized membrane protein
VSADRATRRDWAVPAALIVLGVVPSTAGVLRVVELVGGGAVTAANARFFASPLPVILHVLSVVPFSLLGALQFSEWSRVSGWHRRAGPALWLCGLVAAATGMWMAHFYPWPSGDGYALYVIRIAVGAAMTMSLILALAAIRRRDVGAHEAWMTRAYALGLGAATQVLTHLPWFVLVGRPGESGRTFLMADAWIINLLVAEAWILHRPRLRDRGRRPAHVFHNAF